MITPLTSNWASRAASAWGEYGQNQNERDRGAAIAPATVHLLVSQELDGSAALRTCTSQIVGERVSAPC